jgi:chromate transporter
VGVAEAARGEDVIVTDNPLVRLVILFGSLSLVSFGGGNTVLPAMHREAVDAQHWLTDRQFADLFALAQAAPGPSSLIVSLIGFAAAGITGAAVATVAMLLPSGVLVYAACRGWERLRKSRWRPAIEHGLAPVTVGLVFASALTVTRAADHGAAAYVLTAVATVVLARTSVNPLLVMAGAAALGLLGVI